MRETTLMKLRLNKLAVSVIALAALAVWATPASAGDWNNGDGSLKESRGRAAVAVPVPMPIPEHGPGWYLRGSVGYAFKQTGDIISSGADIGAMESLSEAGGHPSLGFGFGAYINNNIRWDLTGDVRTAQRISSPSVRHYNATTNNKGETVTVYGLGPDGKVLALGAPGYEIHTFDMSRSEEVKAGNQTFLANAYYEPLGAGAFKPYIGAGAGFAVNTIKRTYNETGVCSGTDLLWNDPFGRGIGSFNRPVCTAEKTTVSSVGVTNETGFGLAGALMAGVGYEIRDGLTLDVGYRYLWQAGSVAALAAAGPVGQINKIELGDRVDHEVRTSLRWAIK
jgi:opacity protein-like surface antigen